MKVSKYILSVILSLYTLVSFAQTNSEVKIFDALKDEMSRSLTDLKLDKFNTPFYISNCLTSGVVFNAKATLGAIVQSKEFPIRQQSSRLMVGDYSLNDENFVGNSMNYGSGGANLSLPIDNDYLAIRRAIWSTLDRTYKSSIDTYSQKVTAIAQQNKEESEKLDDFTKVAPITFLQPEALLKYDKALWEKNIKEISGVFCSYPKIQKSSVDVFFINSNFYVINSGGTKIKYNATVACFLVNATTQATDGEILRDYLCYFAPINDQLPTLEKMKTDVKEMAEALQTRCSAPIIEEAYQGPVVFESDALAELFSSKLFGGAGLFASREPIYANGSAKGSTNKMENKIGKRICSENITIVSVPKTKVFGNTPLIGSFEIDAEGVIPADNLTLVDKGILKTLLSTRTPTAKIRESNGYNRFSLMGGNQKSAGVIDISYNNGQSYTDFMNSIAEQSIKNGLDYFYVIRKFETSNLAQYIQPSNSGLSKPLAIYKVSAKTGEQKLVRTAVISDFPMLSLKYVLGGTAEQTAYNTISNQLTPVSYIVPRAMAFNDISIEKDNSPKTKLPIVENPLYLK